VSRVVGLVVERRSRRGLAMVILVAAAAVSFVPGDKGGAATAGPDDDAFVPMAPQRVLDSRSGVGVPAGRIAGGHVVELQVLGRGGVPTADVAAVVLNVTADQAAGTGFVTVWPCGSPPPEASNLNYAAGDTIANLVIARLSPAGTVCLFTFAAVHLIADVNGWYPTADLGAWQGTITVTRSYSAPGQYSMFLDGNGTSSAVYTFDAVTLSSYFQSPDGDRAYTFNGPYTAEGTIFEELTRYDPNQPNEECTSQSTASGAGSYPGFEPGEVPAGWLGLRHEASTDEWFLVSRAFADFPQVTTWCDGLVDPFGLRRVAQPPPHVVAHGPALPTHLSGSITTIMPELYGEGPWWDPDHGPEEVTTTWSLTRVD
jgi:hypothetical protein